MSKDRDGGGGSGALGNIPILCMNSRSSRSRRELVSRIGDRLTALFSTFAGTRAEDDEEEALAEPNVGKGTP
eukprot:12190452-Karenia_brevis.AAC.1